MFELKKFSPRVLSSKHHGAIVVSDEVLEGDVIVDKSWIESEITKIKALAKHVEELYELPLIDSYEDKNMYDWFFKNRDVSSCPNCGFDFGKDLQRAKRCPKCNEYLSVRYGHLLTNKELDEYAGRMKVIAVTKIGVPNRIDEIRMCERSGASDIAGKIIHEIIEQLSELVK